jgi:hypothetical protein
MNIHQIITCKDFPCTDVLHERFTVPKVEIDPQQISVLMISEAAAPVAQDDFYAGEAALFAQTTLLAFQDAGVPVSSFQDILARGIYLTTAVKCAKTAYGIETATVQACSRLLEQEIAQFPNVKGFLLMGDVAIKALNGIAKHSGEARPVPAGSTYKIRGGDFRFRGARVFPSYLQAGASFGIEKSKRKMIAEDIRAALQLVA